jgi:hypothetical protein
VAATATVKAVAWGDDFRVSETAVFAYTMSAGGGQPPSGGSGGVNPPAGGGAAEEIPGTDPPAAGGYQNPYADVADTDWFAGAAQFVTENGLMYGTSADTFAPNETTTRAMLLTTLYRLAGQPAVTGKNPFPDVSDGQWYTDAVIWAAEFGLLNGYPDGTCGWDDPVTREQAVTLLYRCPEKRSGCQRFGCPVRLRGRR